VTLHGSPLSRKRVASRQGVFKPLEQRAVAYDKSGHGVWRWKKR
jgi:hypothetical protein